MKYISTLQADMLQLQLYVCKIMTIFLVNLTILIVTVYTIINIDYTMALQFCTMQF